MQGSAPERTQDRGIGISRVLTKRVRFLFAEAEISDIELSALLVDRAFAGSRENGQYSLGFGSPGERRRLADRADGASSRWGRPVSHCLRVGLPFWLTADGAGRSPL